MVGSSVVATKRERDLPKILIVLVNWRRGEDTIACVRSLARSTLNDVLVSVCENGSGDVSVEQLRNFFSVDSQMQHPAERTADYEAVRFLCEDAVKGWLVLSKKNLGFAGGNNLALKVARQAERFDYVWFLNNDTEVEPDCLEKMLQRMKSDPRIGICGSTLVYAHDRRTVQCFGGSSANFWTGMTREIGNGNEWPCSVDQARVESEMTYVAGASMLVSSAFLEKVGLMTEDYFIFYEELDWAMRARRAGFRLGYAKDAIVYHKEGASIGTGKAQSRSALAEYYGLRNKLLFTWRFVPWAFPSVWAISWLQVARRVLLGRLDRAFLMARTLLGAGAAHRPR